MNSLKLAVVTAALLVAAAVATTTEGSEWTFRDIRNKWSPKDWGHYSPLCNTGDAQSPIDFSQVSPDWNLRPLQALWGLVRSYTLTVTPKRTLRVTLKDQRPSLFDRNAKLTGAEDYEYLMDYIDVVSPSAHTFGGAHRDVELMFVHSLAAKTTGNVTMQDPNPPRFIVSATFDTTSRGSNTFFAKLLHGLDDADEADNQTQAANDRYVEAVTTNTTLDNDDLKDTVGSYAREFSRQLNLAEARPSARDYYTYGGSIQHPPCTESARWAVFTEVSTISAQQLGAIRRLLNVSDVIDPVTGVAEGNNRPIEEVPSRTSSAGVATGAGVAVRFHDYIGDDILLAEPKRHSIQEHMDGITWAAVGCSIAALVIGVISLRVSYA